MSRYWNIASIVIATRNMQIQRTTPSPPPPSLTVRLLVSRTSTWTTKLLRLTSSAIGDEECSVVCHKSLLELVLGVLVNVLLVVGDDRFRDGLSDGIDLRCVTTTGDSYSDVDIGKFVEAEDEKRLVNLIAVNPAVFCDLSTT
jgi:hypothetical protein